MAEATNPIFNKKAAEKLRSPDDLDKYVQVTNPSVWVVMVGCVALIVGLLAWGVFGAVTTSVTTTGAVIDVSAIAKNNEKLNIDQQKAAICFLSADNMVGVDVGDYADVGGQRMEVCYVASIPAAAEEWDNVLGSKYLVKTMFTGDWAFPVVFQGDVSNLQQGVPLKVVITTDRITPISLILKGRS